MTTPTILTFFIGGTYSAKHDDAWELFDLDKNYKDGNFGDRIVSEWDGGNNHKERVDGAADLRDRIKRLAGRNTEVINIIGFSHGGTVGLIGLNGLLTVERWEDFFDGTHSDALDKQYRLFTIAMPALTRYEHIAREINDWKNVEWYNIYSPRDSVQGTWAGIRFKDDFVNKGRTYFEKDQDGYHNIVVDDPKKGRRTIHQSLPSLPVVTVIIERAVING